MAATLVLSVSYQGTNANPLKGDNVTGIDLVSTDNSINSLANRQAYPITVGNNSFEKWVQLKITATPTNYVTNFKLWGDGAVDTSTTLVFTSGLSTYTVPVASTSAIATANWASYTAGSKATWDTTTYTSANLNSYTKYAVFQLQVGATAGPGNWTQETVNYSYDEA